MAIGISILDCFCQSKQSTLYAVSGIMGGAVAGAAGAPVGADMLMSYCLQNPISKMTEDDVIVLSVLGARWMLVPPLESAARPAG